MSSDKDTLDNMEILKTDHLYPSGYRYPLEEAQRVFAADGKFMQRVKAGALRGQYGQPLQRPGETYDDFTKRLGEIDEQQVSHVIEDVRLQPDGRVMATIKPTGPQAARLVKLAEHQRPRFAMRAFMQVERRGGVISPVYGTMDVVTYDLVAPEYLMAAKAQVNDKRLDARKIAVPMTKAELARHKGHPGNSKGRPGDIAISGVIINGVKNHWELKLPLARTHPVFLCCKDGSWMKVGTFGEWFGSPPGVEPIYAYMYPSPSGMAFQEYLGARWYHCTHVKYFGEYDDENNGNVDFVHYLVEYYKTQEIPRRNTYRNRIKKPEVSNGS